MPPSEHQAIFYSESGRRWRSIRRGALMLALVCILLAIFGSRAIYSSPLHGTTAAANPAPASSSFSELPGAGIPNFGSGVLQRIVNIQRRPGSTVAVDLFTGEVVHHLAAAESTSLGAAQYAVQRYGTLPPRQLALSFDDGPDPIWTPKILDLLSENHVQATFCLIGTNVAKYPELARRIVREGHLLCNHTLSHPDIGTLTSLRIQEELVVADRLIRTATGHATRLYRNPYGGNDSDSIGHDLKAIYTAQKLGYAVLAYDLDAVDWRFKRGLPPKPLELDGQGHVILMHDGGGDRALTYSYLQQTLRRARAQGYVFTTAQWTDSHPGTVMTAVSPSLPDYVAFYGAKALFNWSNYVLKVLLLIPLAVGAAFIGFALVHELRNRRKTIGLHFTRPRVSVVIAAYNEDKVIAKTLGSLVHSDYRNFEIVVVNDGSIDGTGAILEDFRRCYKGIRVFTIRNSGKGHALNLAFREAMGDLVVTLDADTLFLPHTIRLLVDHFRDHQVGAVAGLVKVGNTHNLWTRWQALEYLSTIGVERTAHSLLGTIMVVPGACAAWRKRAVLSEGGYTTDTLAEDCDLTLKMQRAGWRIKQDNLAIAYTEAPQGLQPLLKQRFRWTFGNIQALWKHRRMMFRPRHGLLGMIVMPYTFLTLALPIIFLPVLLVSSMSALVNGQSARILWYVGIFTLAQVAVSVFGVLITRASVRNLLVAPLFRVINEPLRTYILYKAFFAALKGRAHGWNKSTRVGSVRLVEPTGGGMDDGAARLVLRAAARRGDVIAERGRDAPQEKIA